MGTDTARIDCSGCRAPLALPRSILSIGVADQGRRCHCRINRLPERALRPVLGGGHSRCLPPISITSLVQAQACANVPSKKMPEW
ncbi:hypothetical protein K6W98_03120 [Burkholderia cepacia]|nr:hypothetical protein [Burkholderia cepacia]HDR9757069.1 hypothetical protein [Burkholderia cepacia ATCC 25416]MBY4735738.1 hypothetical protein [Burkholderia cepacia]MBY4742776.1 hypothetical protein [Burkholderia cepacia]MBY4756897.1 hypothetical protein [Burkholderia cepacia]